MTDIVQRLRWQEDWPPSGVMLEEAANEIERLRNVLAQYRDDLMYPPTGEHRERRIKMVKKLLEGK